MSRLLTLVFAALALASTTQAATTYRDPEGRFSLIVPPGWVAEKPMEEKIAVVVGAPGAPLTAGFCMVMVTPTPETRTVTQADIDQGFGALFNSEFWAAAFTAAGYQDVTIESSGAQDQGGRKVYYVVANATISGQTTSIKVKDKQVLHAIPGAMQFVNCTAQADSYAASEAAFEIVFASFAPKAGDYIVQAPQSGRSMLTLYSGPRFDGVTRVVAEDTPNLPLAGWRGATASFAVSGFGQWQMCDGLNYAGNCRLIVAANAGLPAMRIGSVRRYLTPHDFRGALSVAGQATGDAYSAAARRVTRAR